MLWSWDEGMQGGGTKENGAANVLRSTHPEYANAPTTHNCHVIYYMILNKEESIQAGTAASHCLLHCCLREAAIYIYIYIYIYIFIYNVLIEL